MFGALAYAFIHPTLRKNNDLVAEPGFFTGLYDAEAGYQLWFPRTNTVKFVPDVRFDEKILYKNKPSSIDLHKWIQNDMNTLDHTLATITHNNSSSTYLTLLSDYLSTLTSSNIPVHDARQLPLTSVSEPMDISSPVPINPLPTYLPQPLAIPPPVNLAVTITNVSNEQQVPISNPLVQPSYTLDSQHSQS